MKTERLQDEMKERQNGNTGGRRRRLVGMEGQVMAHMGWVGLEERGVVIGGRRE